MPYIKLVRDRIRSIPVKGMNGQRFVQIADLNSSLVPHLLAKLVEETIEVGEAQTIWAKHQELADVREVYLCVLQKLGKHLNGKLLADVPRRVRILDLTVIAIEAYVAETKDEKIIKLLEFHQHFLHIVEKRSFKFKVIEEMRLKKREEKGGFDEGWFLCEE